MKKHSHAVPVHTRKGKRVSTHHQPVKPATGGTTPAVKGSAVQGAAPVVIKVSKPKPDPAATSKKTFPLPIKPVGA